MNGRVQILMLTGRQQKRRVARGCYTEASMACAVDL